MTVPVRQLARGTAVAAKSVRSCPACGSVLLSFCACLDPDLAGVAPVWAECRSCGWDERSEPF